MYIHVLHGYMLPFLVFVVFLISRVYELRRSAYSDVEAVCSAVDQTGAVITSAGVIMVSEGSKGEEKGGEREAEGRGGDERRGEKRAGRGKEERGTRKGKERRGEERRGWVYV